jgi:hypothetical protein
LTESAEDINMVLSGVFYAVTAVIDYFKRSLY